MFEAIFLPRVLFADTAVPGGMGCRMTTLEKGHLLFTQGGRLHT